MCAMCTFVCGIVQSQQSAVRREHTQYNRSQVLLQLGYRIVSAVRPEPKQMQMQQMESPNSSAKNTRIVFLSIDAMGRAKETKKKCV